MLVQVLLYYGYFTMQSTLHNVLMIKDSNQIE